MRKNKLAIQCMIDENKESQQMMKEKNPTNCKLENDVLEKRRRGEFNS